MSKNVRNAYFVNSTAYIGNKGDPGVKGDTGADGVKGDTGDSGTAGDVIGPVSSVDNAIARFDGITGKLIQNSTVILDDTANMTSVNSLTLIPVSSNPGGNNTIWKNSTNSHIYINNYDIEKLISYVNLINVGIGSGCLQNTTSGNANVCMGNNTSFSNTTGTGNVSIGTESLYANLVGNYNTCLGNNSLYNCTASYNCALGHQSMYNCIGGAYNIAIGVDSLMALTSGSQNVSIGYRSLTSNNSNSSVAIGNYALEAITGGGNIGIGYNCATNAPSSITNNIYMGSPGDASDVDNSIHIGGFTHTKAYISGIRGITTLSADAIPVLISSSGQLGTVSSSIKYKENVTDLINSELIYKIETKNFNYKTQPNKISYGVIAEQVEQIEPNLCIYQPILNEKFQPTEQKELLTVDYNSINILMLREIQKLNDRISTLENMIQPMS